MLVKEIIDTKLGKKWEIYKKDENEYFYKYYEFYQACGWHFIFQDGDEYMGYYPKESVEEDFEIKVA